MNKHEMHSMVEYIKTQHEFPFDGIDVEESMEEVLAYFGLHPKMEADEREEMRKELLPMAIQAELAEIARLADVSLADGLDCIQGRADRKHNALPGALSLFPQQRITENAVAVCRGVSPIHGGNAPRGE